MVEQDEQPDVLLSVRKVSEMFDVEPATVRVWIREGLLRAVKIGKGHYWRVPQSAARELAQRKYGSESQHD